MKRLGIAVIGLGRVGRACVEAAREAGDMRLAGIVRRPEKVAQPLPEGWRDLPVAAHISELRDVDAALICVPTDSVLGTAQQLLQQRIPIVECATLEGPARDAHRDEIGRLAEHHRVPAIVGAGWECGTLPLFKRLFELLIPKGRTEITNRPGVSLHHTSAAQDTKGVRGRCAPNYAGRTAGCSAMSTSNWSRARTWTPLAEPSAAIRCLSPKKPWCSRWRAWRNWSRGATAY